MSKNRVLTPTDQAKVERQHLTTLWQVWRKSGHHDWQELFSYCQQRRQRLNFDLPCSTLDDCPPIDVFQIIIILVVHIDQKLNIIFLI